jgi:sulfoxide reductase heme-binding subunit YedZ
MKTINAYLRRHWFWIIVNCAALIPLLHLLWDFANNQLSANPIQDITLRTGDPALILLLLSLACTPLQTIFGWRLAGSVRKSLGLQAFMYAGLHFLTFIGLDYGFSLDLILRDGLAKKPYILAGLAALLILLPLAITSTQGWQRRLARRWKRLHRWVYAAGALAVIHFFWLAKAAEKWEPLLYGMALAILLALRIPVVRNRIVKQRQPRAKRPATLRSTTARESVPG